MLLTAIAIISSCFNTHPSCVDVLLDKILVLCDNIGEFKQVTIKLNKETRLVTTQSATAVAFREMRMNSKLIKATVMLLEFSFNRNWSQV